MPTPKVNSWLGWRIFTVNSERTRWPLIFKIKIGQEGCGSGRDGRIHHFVRWIARDSLARRTWFHSLAFDSWSSYKIQFQGSYCSFNSKALWSANAEGKHKFFTWLLVQIKVLIADKLLARNWPYDPRCILCNQALESAMHLCLKCVFARQAVV
jgi:hypothetical protein